MTPKRLWNIAWFLFVIYAIVCIMMFLGTTSTKYVITGTGKIELFLTTVMIAALSFVMGAALAIIPIRNKSYADRLKLTFPGTLSVILLLMIALYGYLVYLKKIKGEVLKPVRKYEDIKIPVGLDCSSAHLGKFETKEWLLYREVEFDVYTNKETNSTVQYNINWVSDCECIVNRYSDNSYYYRFKIIKVDTGGYSTYVNYNSEYADFVRVNRVKNKASGS